jgi:hypothetical protein
MLEDESPPLERKKMFLVIFYKRQKNSSKYFFHFFRQLVRPGLWIGFEKKESKIFQGMFEM